MWLFYPCCSIKRLTLFWWISVLTAMLALLAFPLSLRYLELLKPKEYLILQHHRTDSSYTNCSIRSVWTTSPIHIVVKRMTRNASHVSQLPKILLCRTHYKSWNVKALAGGGWGREPKTGKGDASHRLHSCKDRLLNKPRIESSIYYLKRAHHTPFY